MAMGHDILSLLYNVGYIWENMEIDTFQCFANAWHRFGIV